MSSSSTTETSATTVTEDPDPDDLIMAPNDNFTGIKHAGFKYNSFKVTVILQVPCIIVMLSSSLLLVYIILKHLRSIIYLYFSVLFYALTQVILILVLLVTFSVKSITTDPLACKYGTTITSVVLVLPAYALLYITIVRAIFVRRPFDHDLLLRIRYQLAGVFVGVCVVAAVFSLPYFGVCGISPIEQNGETFCCYESGTPGCLVFKAVAIVVGFGLPIILVLFFYGLIYTTVIKSQQRKRKLTQSQGVNSTASGTRSTSSDLAERVRRAVPWCIIIILLLYVFSTVPWIAFDLLQDSVRAWMASSGYHFLLVDLLYTLLLVGSALSPLTYIVSSNTLRSLVVIELQKLRGMVTCESES